MNRVERLATLAVMLGRFEELLQDVPLEDLPQLERLSDLLLAAVRARRNALERNAPARITARKGDA